MVRKTSTAVYREIMENGLLSKKRLQVYRYIYKYGPVTGSQVQQALRSPNSVSESVRNRITELVRCGVVYEVKEVIDPVTNRTVLLFDVTDRLPKVLEVPKTKSQIIRELEIRIKQLEKVISNYNIRNGK